MIFQRLPTNEEQVELAAHELWRESRPGGKRLDWRDRDLQGICLEEAILWHANLAGAHLEGAYLVRTYLWGAHMVGAYLEGAYLRGACLMRSNLVDATLRGAYLECATLRGAYLMGADLRDTDLRGITLRGASLLGAHLEGALLNWESHDLLAEILRQAAGDDPRRRAFAGLASVSPDWCWYSPELLDALAAMPDEAAWAIETLAEWVEPYEGCGLTHLAAGEYTPDEVERRGIGL